MTGVSESLERECAVFTRFLTGLAPSDYVRSRYVAAHEARAQLAAAGTREGALVALATAGPVWCRFADAYAAVFEPRGLLRRKLVVLLAVLETCAPYCDVLERPAPRGWLGAMSGLAARGIGALALGVGAITVVPVARAVARLRRP